MTYNYALQTILTDFVDFLLLQEMSIVFSKAWISSKYALRKAKVHFKPGNRKYILSRQNRIFSVIKFYR